MQAAASEAEGGVQTEHHTDDRCGVLPLLDQHHFPFQSLIATSSMVSFGKQVSEARLHVGDPLISIRHLLASPVTFQLPKSLRRIGQAHCPIRRHGKSAAILQSCIV